MVQGSALPSLGVVSHTLDGGEPISDVRGGGGGCIGSDAILEQ
jgi:hypothetical protein